MSHNLSTFRKTDDSVAGESVRTKDTISFNPTTPSPNEEEEYDSGEEEEYAEEEEYPEMEREGGLVAKSSTIAEDDDEVEEVPETPASTTPFSIIKNYRVSTSTARSTTFEQSSTTQKQAATVPNVRDKYRLVQNQNGRSTVHSSSTEKNTVQPKKIESKIPSLSQKHETKEVVRTKFLPTKDGNVDKKQLPDSFVSVTKQITGVEENKNQLPSIPGKNFESTYYTKSSTCGYFTFSCNIVYGANGRSKICRPKPPTNGKC